MPEPVIEFRYARSSDVPNIVSLIESAYRGEPSRAGWTTEADLLDGQRTDAEEITSLLTRADSRILLACEGAALLGCVRMSCSGRAGYVGMLAVVPKRQTGGLGRRLLTEAEARLVQDFGATSAHMTVIRQRSELIAWYERRGYQNTGRLEPFPYGDPRFGLPRRPDLEFTVLEKHLAHLDEGQEDSPST